MSGGGIIIQRNSVMLVTLTEPTYYEVLCRPGLASEKAVVDSINAKDPASRTQEDLDALYDVFDTVRGCE